MQKINYTINDSAIKSCRLFSIPGKHVFFGYYDIPQINKSGDKLLVNVTDKHADPAKDAADIGYFDLQSGQYRKLATTHAWCLQQGSRLRWHPLRPGKILFNDIAEADAGEQIKSSGFTCITKELDINTGESSVVSPALYDVSGDYKYGISIDFFKLQELRPGYGYYDKHPLNSTGGSAHAKKQAKTGFIKENEGIYLVDLQTGVPRLIIPMKELAAKSNCNIDGEHYINHVSFCPGGRMFMFFHIVDNSSKSGLMYRIIVRIPLLRRLLRKERAKRGRHIYLYTFNIDTGHLHLLENDLKTSHYAWKKDDILLTTSEKNGGMAYLTYDLQQGTKNIINHPYLQSDGHPSFFDNKKSFVYDTYPDEYPKKECFQKLYMFNIEDSEAVFLAQFKHKPVSKPEFRCDLHPRLWENTQSGERIITVDTTCEDGVRKAALLELK